MHWLVPGYVMFLSFLMLLSCSDRRRGDAIEVVKESSVVESPTQGVEVPNPGVAPAVSKIKTLKFYFENSGSMDGYVNGHYDIQTVLRELVYALESKSESQKYSFFNTEPHPQGGQSDAFLKKLNIAGIKIGDRSTSDLNLILETVLQNTKDEEISVLVTDGIYSVKAGSPADILGQLKSESVRTFYKFKDRLEKSDLQTLLIKLNSQYKGDYYPAIGGKIPIDQKRPYYIWVFGTSERLGMLRKEVKFSGLPGYINHVVFQASHAKSPYYSIHPYYGKKGGFRPERTERVVEQVTSVTHAEKDSRDKIFQISVGVDMSNVTTEEAYLLDPSNYKVSDSKYKIKEVIPASELTGKNADAISGTSISHIITLETKQFPVADLGIALLNKMPSWIEESHSEDDLKIKGDTNTTLGFKYLIDGIAKAYQKKAVSAEYFNIKVSIK